MSLGHHKNLRNPRKHGRKGPNNPYLELKKVSKTRRRNLHNLAGYVYCLAMAIERTKMNKPSKTEFQDVVNDYINGGMEDMAAIFDQVDNWTHYYKSKFWSAIYEWRASNG